MIPLQISRQEGKCLERARTMSGVEVRGISDTHTLPEWVDPLLVKEGLNFVKRNFFAVLFAHLLSLLFLFCYAPIRSVLIATGRSNSPHNSKLRYFSTLLHIKKWYDSGDDLLNPIGKSSTLQDIVKVTRIHAGVVGRISQGSGAKMEQRLEANSRVDHDLIDAIQHDLNQFHDPNNNDTEYLPPNGTGFPIISQLDMAVTQFCFMGFIPLFPNELGVPLEQERRGLEGFVHLWALFGHYLGIRMEFNLALPENENLRRHVWTELLLPHFSSCHSNTLQLWEWLAQGLSPFIPFIPLKALLLVITSRLLKVEYEKSGLWGQLNFYELFSFHLMSYCFGSWLHTRLGRIFFNGLLRWTIWLFNLSLKLHIRI